jgi:hypothetical protein
MLLTKTKTVSFDGASYNSSKSRDYAVSDVRKFSFPASVPGTVTTYTGVGAGVVTLTAGHGFNTGDALKMFTADGGSFTPTFTITGNLMTITALTNDLFTYNGRGNYNASSPNMPALNAVVQIAKSTVLDLTTAPNGGTVKDNPLGFLVGTDQSPAYFQLWYSVTPTIYIAHHLWNEKSFEYLYAMDQMNPAPLSATMTNINRFTYWNGINVAAAVKLAFLDY